MKLLSMLTAFLLLGASAAAIELDTPQIAYVFDSPKEASITITNDKDIPEQFSLEIIAPTLVELSQRSGTIPAYDSQTIKIKIHPKKELIGQTYESRLELTVGEKKYVRKMAIAFKEAQPAPPEDTAPQDNGGEGQQQGIFSGLFALASTPETGTLLTIDIILAIIAAVLLIAFIARFVKRMEGH